MNLKLIKKLLKPYQDKKGNCRIAYRRAGQIKFGYIELSESWANKVLKRLKKVKEIKEVFIEKKNEKGKWIKK